MKKTHLIFIVISSLSVMFCNKNEEKSLTPSEIKIEYLQQSITPYKFKTGSYWVYENDTSGILDSVIVLNTENDFYWSVPQVHGKNGIKSEYFKINLQSLLTNIIYNDYLTYNFIKRNGGGEYGNKGQPIFVTNSSIGYGFSGMVINSKFPNIIIKNHNFSNVVVSKITSVNQYQIEFTNDTYLYYSDSIGLVKKITQINSSNIDSWSLKRWNIKK